MTQITEEIYILKDIQSKIEKSWMEQIISHTEARTGLQQIQNDLKHLEKQVIAQNYEIAQIREKVQKHDKWFLWVWIAIVIIWFFIIWLLSR